MKPDAEAFYGHRKCRMKYFELELEASKTGLIEFGRFVESNRKNRGDGRPESFNFLGFTHSCSHSKTGRFRVKKETNKKELVKKSKEINALIRDMRNLPIKNMVKKLNKILFGYYHYYGMTDSSVSLRSFYNVVRYRLYHGLSRRSQRKLYKGKV